MKVKEVLKILKITRPTLTKYVKNGKIKVKELTSGMYDNLAEIQKMFEVLSFDNLAINQLDVKRIVPVENWDEFYMGDDGGFTFYIDVVKGEFAKNSLSDERFPIGDLSIDEMFNFIQEKYKK